MCYTETNAVTEVSNPNNAKELLWDNNIYA